MFSDCRKDIGKALITSSDSVSYKRKLLAAETRLKKMLKSADRKNTARIHREIQTINRFKKIKI